MEVPLVIMVTDGLGFSDIDRSGSEMQRPGSDSHFKMPRVSMPTRGGHHLTP